MTKYRAHAMDIAVGDQLEFQYAMHYGVVKIVDFEFNSAGHKVAVCQSAAVPSLLYFEVCPLLLQMVNVYTFGVLTVAKINETLDTE